MVALISNNWKRSNQMFMNRDSIMVEKIARNRVELRWRTRDLKGVWTRAVTGSLITLILIRAGRACLGVAVSRWTGYTDWS